MAMEHSGVEEKAQVDENIVLVGMIPWLITGVGVRGHLAHDYPSTSNPSMSGGSSRPLEEVRRDPGNQAQDEEEQGDGMFALAT